MVRYCRSEGWDYVVGIQREKPENVPTAGKSIELVGASGGGQTKVQDVRPNVPGLTASQEETASKVPVANPAVDSVLGANRSAVMFPGRMKREAGHGTTDRGLANRDRLDGSRERDFGARRQADLENGATESEGNSEGEKIYGTQMARTGALAKET